MPASRSSGGCRITFDISELGAAGCGHGYGHVGIESILPVPWLWPWPRPHVAIAMAPFLSHYKLRADRVSLRRLVAGFESERLTAPFYSPAKAHANLSSVRRPGELSHFARKVQDVALERSGSILSGIYRTLGVTGPGRGSRGRKPVAPGFSPGLLGPGPEGASVSHHTPASVLA
jgi:hypothetical protein